MVSDKPHSHWNHMCIAYDEAGCCNMLITWLRCCNVGELERSPHTQRSACVMLANLNFHQKNSKTTAFSVYSVWNIICNILCHEHTMSPSQNYCYMWSCQSWALPFTAVESDLNIFSSLSKVFKASGSCCRLTEKVKIPSLKSSQSAPLPQLVGFELHAADFWSQEVQSLIIWLSRQLQLITRDVWKYFSYLSTPTITQKKLQPSPLLPRLQANKETFHFIMLSKDFIHPWVQHLSERRAAR